MKKIILVFIILALIFSIGTIAQAATATIELNASNDIVKPGDTFTISLIVNSPEGINGVVGIKATYDTDKLELVSSQTSSNFTNIGTDSAIDLITSSSEKITSDNVFTWNFKVKENITSETTTEISINNLSVDTDSATDSEVNLSGKSKTITIKPENVQDPVEEPKQEEPKQEEPKQEEPKQEEPKQEEPKQEEPKQEEPKQEETKQEETKQEEPKQEEPKQEEPKSTSSNTQNNSKKDQTVYNVENNKKASVLPKTGKGRFWLGTSIIIAIISLTVTYKKYSKYKGI